MVWVFRDRGSGPVWWAWRTNDNYDDGFDDDDDVWFMWLLELQEGRVEGLEFYGGYVHFACQTPPVRTC